MSNYTLNLIVISIGLTGGVAYVLRLIIDIIIGLIGIIFDPHRQTREVQIFLTPTEEKKLARIIKHENRLYEFAKSAAKKNGFKNWGHARYDYDEGKKQSLLFVNIKK